MKKINILLVSLIFFVSIADAQRWDSLGSGLNSIPYSSPAFFGVQALCTYNGNLYAGGFIYVSPSSSIASWNGNNWFTPNSGIINNYTPCYACSNNAPNVAALITYNGNLLAGGFFDSVQGENVNAVAQWNGTNWDSVGEGVAGASKIIMGGDFDLNTFAVYQGDLYAGGAFQYTGDSLRVNHISKWNGTFWNSVGTGMNGWVNCLAVYNGNLYAGGNFDTAGGVPAKNIALYNGTQWSAVGGGISNYGVSALIVYNGLLYAGGLFDSAGGNKASNIASWDGTSWSPVGSGILPVQQDSGVFALTVYGSVLCAGGQFSKAGSVGANNIAFWDGTGWNALGSGVNGSIEALTVYNSSLIAGGVFDSAGGIPANNIAQWTSPLGINELNNKNGEVTVYPNPNSGQFTMQLSVVSGQSSVEIYNVLGEKVYSETLHKTQGNNLISLVEQPAGVYFYKVFNDKEIIGSGKIIIDK